jgi:hypothetical protein
MPHNKYNLDHNQLLKQLSREQLNNTKVQKENRVKIPGMAIVDKR